MTGNIALALKTQACLAHRSPRTQRVDPTPAAPEQAQAEREEGVAMDFVGQVLAERLIMVIIPVAGAIGWVAGYVQGSWAITMWAFLGGMGLASAVALPPWPIYAKHPIKWLPPLPQKKEQGSWLTTAVTGVALVGAVLVAVCTLQNLTSRYMPGLDKAVLARIRRGPVCQLIARATVTLRSYLPRR